MRYNNNVPINFGMFGMGGGMMGGGPPDISTLIPRDASCANCHNNMAGSITVEHTPQQTAGYSDQDLIQIFTMGMKPMGGTFHSPFLKNLPAQFATQIYVQLHTWMIAPEVQQGIVYKLRSITPAPQPDIDLTRLRMMFMNNMAATGGQAGGAATATAGSGT
jgi:hypothetical protein